MRRTALLAAWLSAATLGCPGTPAPPAGNHPGTSGGDAIATSTDATPPTTAVAAPLPAEATARDRDEHRLAQLYPEVLKLARDANNVELLRSKADEVVQLLHRLTGRTKDDPTYKLVAEAVIREAAKKYNPELFQQISAAEKSEAEASRRAEVALTYYQMIQVRGALAKFEGSEGHLPDQLSELRRTGFDLALTKDSWGRLLVYERRDPGFALGSLGPDGTRDTPDDLDAANAAKALGIDTPK